MKTINYKNHTIIIDGITARLYYNNEYVYRTSAYNYADTVKQLKSFINLRLEQIERDKHVNIYA